MNRITLQMITLRAILVIVALYFALYVWPTPYREYRSPDGSSVIRVNRVTGSQHGIRLWSP